MKRIVTIQDLSCVGKCSLSVALPIISAMGVETSVIPTAVLSTHTAFNNFTFKDLTSEINEISKHWKQEKISFDAIYTGYLGSIKQIELISNFFDDYKTNNNIIFIDPVMGDYGKLYAGFTKEFVLKMKRLCAKADIITPNLTEASYLLNIPFNSEYNEDSIKNILLKLSELGSKQVILTGVSFEKNKLGVMAYDSIKQEFYSYFNEKIHANFHGTGDIYASTCIGGLMNNFSLQETIELATDYTLECIKYTINDLNSRTYGVNFENAIPYLTKRIFPNKK